MRITLLSLICAAVLLSGCSKAQQESADQSENFVNALSTSNINAAEPEIAVTKVSSTDEVEKDWGTIKGRIVVKGDVPAPAKIPLIKLAGARAGKGPVLDPSLIVIEDGGLKNVFVFLYLGKEPQNPPVHPCYEMTAKDKVKLEFIFCMCEPHALSLRTSQILLIKNSDPHGHNAQFNSRINPSNPLVRAEEEFEINPKGPEKLPIKVTCNIHVWESAFIIVRDEPYVAITDENGNFEIKNMPAGDWQFQFWHERCGHMAALEKGGKPLMEGRIPKVTLTVTDGKPLDLGDLTISADSLKGD